MGTIRQSLFVAVVTLGIGHPVHADWDDVVKQGADILGNALRQSQQPAPSTNNQPPPPHPPAPQAQKPSRPVPTTASEPSPDAALVGEAQRLLAGLGYDVGTPDGAMGARTTRALQAFQRDRGQPITGRVTQATLTALRSTVAGDQSRAPGAGDANAANAKPSFDCGRAASPTEEAICGDPDLARLDVSVSRAFLGARTGMSGAAAVDMVTQQRAWIKQRNLCGADADCLQTAMTDRVATLGGTIVIAPVGTSRPLPISSPGAAPTPTQAAVAPDSYDPAQLLRPPAGFRPLRLPLWQGLPLVSFANGDETQRFFRLVALGLRPGLLEERERVSEVRRPHAVR